MLRDGKHTLGQQLLINIAFGWIAGDSRGRQPDQD